MRKAGEKPALRVGNVCVSQGEGIPGGGGLGRGQVVEVRGEWREECSRAAMAGEGVSPGRGGVGETRLPAPLGRPVRSLFGSTPVPY